MATIDSELVRAEIRAIIATSQAVKSKVKAMFAQLEDDPSVYDELDIVDPSIAQEFDGVVLRKIYLTSGRHDFRIIFAHWKYLDPKHVDLLLAFPRNSDGYDIDWDWMARTLRGRHRK